MPASREYASNSGGCRTSRCERVLVVSPTWLGDSIMTMPAILALHQQAGPLWVTVLAKPAVAPLWRMCPVVDEVLVLKAGIRGTLDAVKLVKAGNYDFAYVVPNSFRSAFIPFLAAVPGRRGFDGHQRRWMLTESIGAEGLGKAHQSDEAFLLFGLEPVTKMVDPLLRPSEQDCLAVLRRLSLPHGEVKPRVAIFPGAARGVSKCWPEDRFAEVGRRLVENGCRVLLLGAASDRESCGRIAGQIGSGAVSMAGETTLAELAALLSLSRVAVANDSGGMHLAAAVGTKVVALYGATDPAITGPLGDGHIILMSPGVQRGRDIDRKSKIGKSALEAISVDSVCEAILRVL